MNIIIHKHKHTSEQMFIHMYNKNNFIHMLKRMFIHWFELMCAHKSVHKFVLMYKYIIILHKYKHKYKHKFIHKIIHM